MRPQEGPTHPQISVPVIMGTIKVVLGSRGKKKTLDFLYSEPFFVSPKTVTLRFLCQLSASTLPRFVAALCQALRDLGMGG